jgi:SWI/SNF-related matrix-associated actin-dependent regulator of chromatin subfamily A-like protein 1
MILLELIPNGGGMADLRCGYDQAAITQFRAMPGCRWDADRRVWTAPAEAASLVASTLVKAKIAKLRGPLVEIPTPLTIDESADDDIYEYQQEGVSFIVDRCRRLGGALLADDMGLGKSVQALRAIQHLDPYGQLGRVLILCPAVVLDHWVEEAARWLDATATKVTSAYPHWDGIGIMSYGVFANVMLSPHHLEWRDLNGQWFRHQAYTDPDKAQWACGLQRRSDPGAEWRVVTVSRPLPASAVVVLDEVHYLASYRTQRSKAVRTYLETARPKAVIGLSGTPLTARPRDLWHPLDLLYPNRFGRYFAFTERYCDGHYKEIDGLDKEVWDCDGASRLDELTARLKPLMLRRTKNETLELPERQRIVLPVSVPQKALASLSRAFAGIEGSATVQSALSGTEGYKVPHAVELTADLVKQGHRVLLLTTRKATAADIAKRLRKEHIDAPVATGDTDAPKRAKLLNATKQAAVATIYSVTTGINLTGFDVAIFVGLDWVPSTLLQAEARLHRIGQQKKVTYYYLISMNSIDEIIRSKVIERLSNFVTLMGDANSDEKQMAATLGQQQEEDLIAEIVKMVRETQKGTDT